MDFGRHRLMCGDSTSIHAVEALMAGQKVNLLVTDPPYNVAYEGKTADALTIQNDDMSDGEFRQFLRDVYSAADAVMQPGAVFYIWHADSEGYNFRGAAHDVGWQIRQCLIWNKTHLCLAGRITTGNMNHAFTDGKKVPAITGERQNTNHGAGI